MKEKLLALELIYSQFETAAEPYRNHAACSSGCAFCCSAAGSIDITTLEGLKIIKSLKKMPRPRQKTMEKALGQEVKHRERGMVVPCPFLLKNDTCMIYLSRPFSCRRIYSYHRCTKENPPMLHKDVMAISNITIRQIQKIDNTGYSGHLTFILHMLETPKFLETYLKGEFRPGEVVLFGKTHGISINSMNN